MAVNMEDLIAATSGGSEKPSIVEALLSTVDSIFTNNRMLQRSRLSPRHIRGVSRVIGTQSFLRSRFERTYNPVLNREDGEFTHRKYDNRVLTAVVDSVLAGRISLNGASRDEIIRIFQAVGGTATTETGPGSQILGRFDY